MSDIVLFRSQHPTLQHKFVVQLEQEFTNIIQRLYTADVSSAVLDREVLPYVAKNITFKDPCQEGSSREVYGLIIKGSHHMLRFTFDTFQLNVKLNDDGKTGRCIVDGIANLEQLSWIYTYPLRLITVFEFRLLDAQSIDEPLFEIFRHEQMWSLADLIDAIPLAGWFARSVVRRGLRYLFVAISAFSCFFQDSLTQSLKKRE